MFEQTFQIRIQFLSSVEDAKDLDLVFSDPKEDAGAALKAGNPEPWNASRGVDAAIRKRSKGETEIFYPLQVRSAISQLDCLAM